jgi:hypothetical protein
MKTIAVCAGLLLALSANADAVVRAKLVSQRLVSSFPGTPILICRYLGPEARYEVVASSPKCAPYFPLSTSEPEAGQAGRPALAKAPSP